MRLLLAVWMARLVGGVSRLSGRAGSALPGRIARKIDPSVLRRLTGGFPQGVVLLTGTNGKTTTSAVAVHMLRAHGMRVINNHAGANLIWGLTATLVQAEPCRIVPQADMALLETDEASIVRASAEIVPQGVVVTNFFRDQLDRYGELSTVVNFVRRGIQNMASSGWLVLNADDPQVAYLGHERPECWYFGLSMAGSTRSIESGISDARFCPRCGQGLTYTRVFYAHLGWYRCGHCGWQRPRPHLVVTNWNRQTGVLTMEWQGREFTVPWRIPGLYNFYNVAAATTMALRSGMGLDATGEALRSFRPAFGRMEQVSIEGATVRIALVKNPVGFNQVLQAVSEDDSRNKVGVVLINDQYADGRDVSWLWDVDFEGWVAQMNVTAWWVGGVRAHDMAVRLKYAGVDSELIHVVEKPEFAFNQAREQYPTADLYVMPTYTALLQIRNYLTQVGHVKHFREG